MGAMTKEQKAAAAGTAAPELEWQEAWTRHLRMIETLQECYQRLPSMQKNLWLPGDLLSRLNCPQKDGKDPYQFYVRAAARFCDVASGKCLLDEEELRKYSVKHCTAKARAKLEQIRRRVPGEHAETFSPEEELLILDAYNWYCIAAWLLWQADKQAGTTNQASKDTAAG